MLKLYKVTFGLLEKGEYLANFSSCNVLAKDAASAIKQSEAHRPKGCFADEVTLIAHVDE